MLAKDLIVRNPFRFFEETPGFALRAGDFGAVVARAGVGKTAFLVQLALCSLLQKKNVLHISLSEPVNKVCLRYDEVIADMAAEYEVDNTEPLREEFLAHRFIMTFKVASFHVATLEERITDLTAQDIFVPHMIIIDGLPLDNQSESMLAEFRRLARHLETPVWISVLTHRTSATTPGGIPLSVDRIASFFKNIIFLHPSGSDIFVEPIKGDMEGGGRPTLLLDPTTMLIRKGTSV